MKKLLFIPLLLFLFGCAPKENHHTFFAMDTVMDFTIYGGDVTALVQTVQEYDAIFSPTKDDSVLSAYNKGSEADNPTFLAVLEDARKYYDKTKGAFDPSLGNLIDLWSEEKVPDGQDIKNAVVGMDKLQNGAKLNLSAIAKGSLSDAIRKQLVDGNVESAIISLGGNILAHGVRPDGKPWVVGIRDPKDDANAYLATIEVSDKFIVSSGNYERYFISDGKRYHHILDPKTAFPAENGLCGVTIIAEDGALADAYSTALFVMGYEEALEFWRKENNFEVIFVFEDKVVVTEGVKDFTLTKEEYAYEVAHR